MGAHGYWYRVKYRPDVDGALQELREREFRAGRYNPVIPFPDFPIGPHSPAPGARHATMAEAFEDADADGTRSIIDLDRVADEPDYGAVTALGDAALLALFGTTRPTRRWSSATTTSGRIWSEARASISSCTRTISPTRSSSPDTRTIRSSRPGGPARRSRSPLDRGEPVLTGRRVLNGKPFRASLFGGLPGWLSRWPRVDRPANSSIERVRSFAPRLIAPHRVFGPLGSPPLFSWHTPAGADRTRSRGRANPIPARRSP